MPFAIQDEAEIQLGNVFSGSYTANILEAEIILRADNMTELNNGCGITIEQNKALDYTFNTGELQIGNTGNTNYVSLISDPSIAITYNIVLPTTAPANDDLLVWSESSGRLIWTDDIILNTLGVTKLDVQLSTIINCIAPVLDLDVANKFYVDNKHYPKIDLFVSSDEYFEIIGTTSTIVDYMQLTPGATGDYEVNITAQFNASLANITAQCVIDLNNLHSLLTDDAVTNATFPVFTTGTTIAPGIYSTAAAAEIVGNVSLDGLGSSDSIFIFRVGGAFSTAASSVLSLTNGAIADNVFFVSTGAISLGANSTLSGTCLSPAAAAGSGDGSSLTGRLYSKNGALGIGGNIENPNVAYPFEMGALKSFAMFTSAGAVTNTGINVIFGDVGTNDGIISGFGDASVTGTIYNAGEGSSLTKFSIYVGEIEQIVTRRQRRDYIDKQDVILIGMVTITDPEDSISMRIVNEFGSSKYYNRSMIVRETSDIAFNQLYNKAKHFEENYTFSYNVTKTSYITVSNFLFKGSALLGHLTSVSILSFKNSTESFTYSIRLWDITNNLPIFEISGFNNTQPTLTTITSFTNEPYAQAMFELQCKISSPNSLGARVGSMVLGYN
jgi:hypothetical protein